MRNAYYYRYYVGDCAFDDYQEAKAYSAKINQPITKVRHYKRIYRLSA